MSTIAETVLHKSSTDQPVPAQEADTRSSTRLSGPCHTPPAQSHSAHLCFKCTIQRILLPSVTQAIRVRLEDAHDQDQLLASLLPMWAEERERCGGMLPPRPVSPPRNPRSLCHAVDVCREELRVGVGTGGNESGCIVGATCLFSNGVWVACSWEVAIQCKKAVQIIDLQSFPMLTTLQAVAIHNTACLAAVHPTPALPLPVPAPTHPAPAYGGQLPTSPEPDSTGAEEGQPGPVQSTSPLPGSMDIASTLGVHPPSGPPHASPYVQRTPASYHTPVGGQGQQTGGTPYQWGTPFPLRQQTQQLASGALPGRGSQAQPPALPSLIAYTQAANAMVGAGSEPEAMEAVRALTQVRGGGALKGILAGPQGAGCPAGRGWVAY